MNPVMPRPYSQVGQGYKKEEESEEKTQDSLHQGAGGNQQQRQNQQNQQNQPQGKTIASGTASDVAKQGRRRNLKPMTREEYEAQQKAQAEKNAQPVQQKQLTPRTSSMVQTPMQKPIPQQPIQPQPVQQPVQVQPQVKEMDAPAGEIEADSRPMAATSNKINIAQILKDFRNTISAIGTPDILREEVEDYLHEIEENTRGEAPSINLVQTDLMNAAAILDRYISETLNKESKVVSKWLDALFLQRINYRYNDGEVNKAFLVKFPESEEEKRAKAEKEQKEQQEEIQEQPVAIQEEEVQQDVPTQYEPIETTPQNRIQHNPHVTSPIKDYAIQKQPVTPIQRKKPEITIIPEDNELKALFIQAKKHAFAHNPSKAMDMFHRALLRAEQIKDGESQSKICLEMGKIYDDNNYLVQALSSYNKSLKSTTDNILKTKAHYSMAQIYDDVNQVEPAINHYLTSVSYAGASDDLSAQCTSLTRIANIFSDRINKKAFEFYNEADILISQTEDSKTKGFVSSNMADAYSTFKRPEVALKYYAKAVKNYCDAKQQDDIADNYKAAAELMLSLNNPAKAKVLLRKALSHTDKIKDAILIDEINDLMTNIA